MKNTYSKKCDLSKNNYIEVMLDKYHTKKGELCLTEMPILWKDAFRQRDLMKSTCRLAADLWTKPEVSAFLPLCYATMAFQRGEWDDKEWEMVFNTVFTLTFFLLVPWRPTAVVRTLIQNFLLSRKFGIRIASPSCVLCMPLIYGLTCLLQSSDALQPQRIQEAIVWSKGLAESLPWS